MVRYWVIAPYSAEDQDQWRKVWEFDKRNSIISIGWRELGDLTVFNRESLRAAIDSSYKDSPSNIRSMYANMIWSFCHEIKPGDMVIARKGLKTIAGVGEVQSAAFYAAPSQLDSNSSDSPYSNHIPMKWLPTPIDKSLGRVAFGRMTLYEISNDQYKSLVDDDEASDIEEKQEGVENITEFVLEKYLEEFIISNFKAVFSDNLTIYTDPQEGVVGQQYTTDVGTIDILGVDANSDSLVVIELKKGREADKVVGQTLRYMGWVEENLARQGQKVKGLIICREADPKLTYALKPVSSISVKYYNIQFRLRDSP